MGSSVVTDIVGRWDVGRRCEDLCTGRARALGENSCALLIDRGGGGRAAAQFSPSRFFSLLPTGLLDRAL